MSSDRTEQATPKRREDARKRGEVARSPRLAAAGAFLAGVLFFQAGVGYWVHQVEGYMRTFFSHVEGTTPLTVEAIQRLVSEGIWLVIVPIVLLMLVIMATGLGLSLLQGGVMLSPEALRIRGDRLNPLQNAKNLFKFQSVYEVLFSIVELVVLYFACSGIINRAVEEIPQLVGTPVARILPTLGSLLSGLGLRIGGVMVVFAAADYGYNWYQHEKKLRMTKQEVKDEFREQEGDPMVKGQRRRAGRALIQKRSMQEVPKADVVITNPTHVAVALRYDRMQVEAPVVVAKGRDLIALRIREIAREHDVEIVEDPPLARALFRVVEPGQAIPPDFYRAVAEILAFVYRKRQRSFGHQ